jgi:hypothetical protein
MSAFDITLSPVGLNLAVPNEAEIEAGNTVVQIVVPVGMMLPFEGAPGQPMVAPVGVIRIPVPRELGIDFGKKIAEACEAMPPTSQIEIASGLNEEALKNAAVAERRMREGQ